MEEVEEVRTARQWSLLMLVPYNAIRQAVRTGQLPARRYIPKGQIFITKTDMEHFIEEAARLAKTEDNDPGEG